MPLLVGGAPDKSGAAGRPMVPLTGAPDRSMVLLCGAPGRPVVPLIGVWCPGVPDKPVDCDALGRPVVP